MGEAEPARHRPTAGAGPDQQLAALLLSADTTVRSERDSELRRGI
jgi:hypothetical protein